MKLRFLKEESLKELRGSIRDNLDRYRSGDFEYLSADSTLSFEVDIELDDVALAKLKAPSGVDYYEPENCAVLVAALKKLTPYQAADERLWAMLSHTKMLEHARARWPIPRGTDAAVAHIETHFFASTQRWIERDNVASRLWWMGHLCSRVEGLTVKAGLEALLHRADVRANIVERPTTGQSIPVFSAILRKLSKSYSGNKLLFERKRFRPLMIKLNGLGGYVLLDALDTGSVEKLIGDIIENDFKLSERDM